MEHDYNLMDNDDNLGLYRIRGVYNFSYGLCMLAMDQNYEKADLHQRYMWWLKWSTCIHWIYTIWIFPLIGYGIYRTQLETNLYLLALITLAVTYNLISAYFVNIAGVERKNPV